MDRSGQRRGWAGAVALVAGAVLALAPAGPGATIAEATPAARPAAASPATGLVRPHGSRAAAAATSAANVGIMTYHGGPVMHHVTAYAVYWQPPGTYMSPNYKALINRWFGDIGTTPSYSVVQQYGDTAAGPPGLDVTFGGAWTDTTAFPNAEGSKANPVTVQALLDHAIPDALNANPGWTDDNSHEIFVYLPKDVYLGAGPSLSFVDFCAFHFAYRLQGETTMARPVGAMPYVSSDQAGCGVNRNGAAVAPNGDGDADSEINTTSHELFESVSDPAYDGTANTGWYYQDASHENGDQCNFVFGAFDAQGGDIVLNGHEYVMQAEWSNQSADPAAPSVTNGCVMRSPMASSVAVTSSANPSGLGQSVTLTATVSPAPATRATGAVQFKDGAATLAAPVPVVGGVASLTTSNLAGGGHPISAVYSGDGNYSTSTSGPLTQTVSTSAFVYPVDGQSNVNTTLSFKWTATAAAQGYFLTVGTALYGRDLVSSGVLPPGQLSLSMPALPTGRTLFATLFTAVNGAWASFQAVTFTAAPGLATFTYPVDNQSNVDTTKAFTWATIPDAQGYYLVVGSALYGSDLVNSGMMPPGQSSLAVPALPVGRSLYATLFTEVNGTWSRVQAVTFTAAGLATFTYPVNNQSGVDTTKAFSWTTVPGAQGYYLTVGTSLYGADLVTSGVMPAGQSSLAMPALPVGRTLHATLYTEVNGAWTGVQAITFTAAPGLATFTYPVDGQPNVDATKAFTWTTIPGAQGYYLVVGTSLYGSDLVNSGVMPAGQSSLAMPSGLPVGRTLYAALFTEVNGTWNRLQTITFSA